MNNFKSRAEAVHGERYDYSESVYTGCRGKITVICRVHGRFSQRAGNHLNGSGCPSCYREANAQRCRHMGKSAKATDFQAKAEAVHGTKYDYSKSVYAGVNKGVVIICPVHGKFIQNAGDHLRGKGCKACGITAVAASNRKTFEQVTGSAVAVHGNRYAYTGLENGCLRIRCSVHGEFKQSVSHHVLRKRGCPKCGGGQVFDTESFKAHASLVHNGAYDYSEAVYLGSSIAVTVKCKKHGPYQQTPHVHLRLLKGAGCPKCHDENQGSHGEKELRDWLSLHAFVCPNDRNIIKPYELDMWLPDVLVGVEYHGLYWHCERLKGKNFHRAKLAAANNAGISLLQFFEDEWARKPDIIKSMLLAKIGKSPNRLFARRCSVVSMSYSEGRNFFRENHLQGADSSSAYLGLSYDGSIVACASFTISRTAAKLQRFACLLYHSIPGAFSKLFSAFLKAYNNVNRVETYANLRYSNGGVYKACGFIELGMSPPGYFYSKMGTSPVRESRQKYQVHKLKKLGYSGTEREITMRMGLSRVYDAGHMRLLWMRD